jgi:hypothetical protein
VFGNNATHCGIERLEMIERTYSATIRRASGNDIDAFVDSDGNIDFDSYTFTVEEASEVITVLTEAIAFIQASAPKPKAKATKKGGAK